MKSTTNYARRITKHASQQQDQLASESNEPSEPQPAETTEKAETRDPEEPG